MAEAREVLDRFFSVRLGVTLADVKPGQVAVATCDRRTYAERGFGFVRLVWVMHFGDRAVVSVHPAAVAEVSKVAWRIEADAVLQDEFLREAVAALQRGLPGVVMQTQAASVKLYHPGDAAALETDGEIRRLRPADKDRWVGERVYTAAAEHPSGARGEAFGLFLGDDLVAEVMTHESSVSDMADLVAEDGIQVAEGYRRRGYGRALLAAWTREMQARGRICLHSTSESNQASIAVARAVGYLHYARQCGVNRHLSDEE